MRLPLYQIDAFTDRVFAGNPAAVCPLDSWLDDATLQAIAAENNLAETAFFVPKGNDFELRWFTPTVEVDLCGHATLASGWLILTRLEPRRDSVTFHSRSGALTVSRGDDRFAMDFPSLPPKPCQPIPGLLEALGGNPAEVLSVSSYYIVVYQQADAVRELKPNLSAIAKLDCFGVVVTAPGEGKVDFVSRFFAPARGVPEDPVTGSAHCRLTPYWAKRLGKTKLFARQVSPRGGELWCEDRGARVGLMGRCAFYMQGSIEI